MDEGTLHPASATIRIIREVILMNEKATTVHRVRSAGQDGRLRVLGLTPVRLEKEGDILRPPAPASGGCGRFPGDRLDAFGLALRLKDRAGRRHG